MCASSRVVLTNSMDCKTVRIFAYSSSREQLNKRSGTRVKTESKTGERRYGRERLARFARIRLLRHALPISLLVLRKKPTVLQSTKAEVINDVKCPPPTPSAGAFTPAETGRLQAFWQTHHRLADTTYRNF